MAGKDSGYEPWARAAIARGERLTPEQGRELLKKLDDARGALERVRQRTVSDAVTLDGVKWVLASSVQRWMGRA